MSESTTQNKGLQYGYPELLAGVPNTNTSLSYRLWLFATRVLALFLLILISPLLLVLWICMKLTTPGPFLFKQSRPGLSGRPFNIYKIRTMNIGAESKSALGTKNTSAGVTRLGRILRTLKIDESPQLFNVLKGDMVFVGPRPIPVTLDKHLREHIPGFEYRYKVNPGLTSVGQICINDNALDEKLIADWSLRFEGELHYIRNRSVCYDIIMLFMTGLYVARKLFKAKSESS